MKLDRTLAFHFETFILNAASGRLPVPNDDLNTRLYQLARSFLGQAAREAHEIDEEIDFFRTVTRTSVFSVDDATFTIVFERMENGHLGCNEDRFSAKLERGAKRMWVDCYVFVSDEITLKFEGFSAEEEAAATARVAGLLSDTPQATP